ncbi:MAG TPA: thioesterase family protein [Marmoricola sp.]
MGYEYDAAIAVQPQGGGVFAADLDPGWVVGGGVNGGYLLSVIGNAISNHLPTHPDPYTVTGYYLSASTPGPAQVRVEDLRIGRGTATVRATLSQWDDAGNTIDRIAVLATYGNLAGLAGEVRTTATPPDLPPIEQCRLTSDATAEVKAFVPMLDRFAMRLDPACAGAFSGGAPSGRPLIQGWYEFADQRPVDPIALLTVVDTLPPITFELGMPGWAPTLELTVHVRATPAPGPLRIKHESRNFSGGFFEEDCEVWDSAGRLVAQSRQLALAPRPV